MKKTWDKRQKKRQKNDKEDIREGERWEPT